MGFDKLKAYIYRSNNNINKKLSVQNLIHLSDSIEFIYLLYLSNTSLCEQLLPLELRDSVINCCFNFNLVIIQDNEVAALYSRV